MKADSPKPALKRELRRLFRAMDFISDRYLARKGAPAKLAAAFYEVYQQLGTAWEHLALQCRHWDGYRKVSGGKLACRICGKIKGTEERWLLLPAKGQKVIGVKTRPNSSRVFPSKQAATITEDGIQFHGATLRVSVHNQYKSKLFRGKHDITIARDRILRLFEDGMECWLDTYGVHLKLPPQGKPMKPMPYSAFLSELPKRKLQKFPVMIEYDKRDHLQGVVIFRPMKRSATKRKQRISSSRG
ncbi:MAG: hypothetical protein FJ395_08345 [Verrucomicrobia bacterium]|nr:hypothetical protein [Verrucomicrobiota bacterium]